MFAVIETGGKQYTVSEGDVIKVEKLDVEDGAEVKFPVLLISKDDKKADFNPARAKVTGSVVKTGKGKKIEVFKYKAKKNQRKRQGHRQPFTEVRITKISAS